MNTIIGKKTLQSQAFLTDGTRIPVTVIDVARNVVVSVNTKDTDGYDAVQLGYGSRKKSTKSLLGHVKKANLTSAPLVIREARMHSDNSSFASGDIIDIESILKPGDIVKVTGLSKGKGFAGVVKRHHFRGGPRTHGQSDRERAPGSIGQTTTPGRVYRGKKMAGRMGHVISSALNLLIVAVNSTADKKTIIIKGLVPGSVNSIVTIVKTGELSEKKVLPLIQKIDAEKVAQEEPVMESVIEEVKEIVKEESNAQIEPVVMGVSESEGKEGPVATDSTQVHEQESKENK